MVPDAAEVDGWFICGPGPMMDAAEGALLERNVPKDRIHIERFTADRPPEAVAQEMAQLQTQAEGVSVAVTLDGRTRKVPFTAGNILDSARAVGLTGAVRLQGRGLCDLPAKVTSGKVEMAARYGLTDEEVAAGYVLTCQSCRSVTGWLWITTRNLANRLQCSSIKPTRRHGDLRTYRPSNRIPSLR